MNLMFKREWIEDVGLNSPEDYEDLSKKYIFLAWLFANDLMVNDGITAEAVEGVDLNPEDYEEEEGMNLLRTYENYNMEEVLPMLKGILL